MNFAMHKKDELTDDARHMIRFCGHMLEPLVSGALFWRAENTLLVADLHFEKMASFARRGQLLPPYDTGLTLARLEADLHMTGAKKLVALGDSFHRADSATQMQASDRLRLDGLMDGVDWTWIAGNHDPTSHDLVDAPRADLELLGVLMRHEPQKSGPAHIAGHLHPAARVRLNGRSVRRPCFVTDGRLMIMPAYGASTGSLNILSPAFSGLLDKSKLQVVMLGTDRVFAVNPRRLCAG